MKQSNPKIVFFGSSRFSEFVLNELEVAGYSPILKISDASLPLPSLTELEALEADIFVVASFGKILPKKLLEIPKYKSWNVHPSFLPNLRGPAPIQNIILGLGEPAVTIIEMDEQMDHGPIIAQEKVEITPWPDHYEVVEEKLAKAGGQLLISLLLNTECLTSTQQDHSKATFTKMIKKEDGLLDLTDSAENNLRKVLAYSTWPGAYLFFKKKNGEEVRVVVKDAEIREGKFEPLKIIPAGKRKMIWKDFLRGNN